MKYTEMHIVIYMHRLHVNCWMDIALPLYHQVMSGQYSKFKLHREQTAGTQCSMVVI